MLNALPALARVSLLASPHCPRDCQGVSVGLGDAWVAGAVKSWLCSLLVSPTPAFPLLQKVDEAGQQYFVGSWHLQNGMPADSHWSPFNTLVGSGLSL